jgi:hypothetical protein
MDDIGNFLEKRLSHPSMKPEIMRNISGNITTKPGETFAIIPIVTSSETLQQATICLWKNTMKKVSTPLEKGIHLVLESVSFSISEFVDFYVLPFAV